MVTLPPFDISLDIKSSNVTVKYNNIICVSGDTKVYTFNISMFDNGSPLDFSTVDHVWIIFKKSDGNTVQGVMTISDALNGLLTYQLGTDEIAKEGSVLAEVEIYGSNGEQLTSNRFEFIVKQELNTDEVVQSSTQYSVLTTTITNVETAESARATAETARQTGYAQMIKDSYVIPQSPVATHGDIATTYPTPVNGWTTRAIDTGKLYRYNSDTLTWDWIDTITTSSYDDLLNEVKAAKNSDPLTISERIHLISNTVYGPFNALKILGRTITNLLGSDGDCEDVSKFLSGYGLPTLTLDNSNKLFGSNSLSFVASSSGHGSGLQFGVSSGKYYLLSFYTRVTSGSMDRQIYDQENTVQLEPSSVISADGNFKRFGIKFNATQDSNDVRFLFKQSGATAVTANLDGIMVNEISQDEYNNLTESQLLEKYNFINLTKSTLCAIRLMSHGINWFSIDNVIDGKYYDGSEKTLTDSIYQIIKVKPNTDFTIYVKNNHSSAIRPMVYELTGDKSSVVNHYTGTPYSSGSTYTKSITTSNSTEYIAISILDIPVDSKDLLDIQLELGLAFTSYEKYNPSISYVYAVDENGNIIYLRSLPNGVKDEVSDGKLYKRTEKIVLDGSRNWVMRSGGDLTGAKKVQITLTDAVLATESNKSARLWRNNDNKNYTITNSIANSYEFGIANSPNINTLIITLPDSDTGWADAYTPSTAEIQAYFSTNNHTLTYQLVNEVPIDINITALGCFDGSTTIIIEPFLNKKFTYSSGINLGTIPVSSIEELEKVSTGELINSSDITLASDGLSLTIVGAVDTEEYIVKAPYRTEESTLPILVLKYPINAAGAIESNSKAISNLSEIVADILVQLMG